MTLKAGPTTSRRSLGLLLWVFLSTEVIAKCLKCGKNGLAQSLRAAQSVYVHVDAKEQNKREALKACAIQRQRGGLSNAGDIRRGGIAKIVHPHHTLRCQQILCHC